MQPFSRGSKVSEVDKLTVFNEVSEGVSLSYKNAGVKEPNVSEVAEQKEYSDLINWLTSYIWDYHKGYRTGEIKRAIDLGSAGHYGEFYGLNKRSFTKFILDHQKANPINQANPVVSNRQETVAAWQPDANQRFNTLKNITVEAYESFKAGRKISRSAGIIYDFLKGITLLILTDDQKREIYEAAKVFVTQPATNAAPQMRDFIKQALLRSDSDPKAEVLRRVKEVAVSQYFENFTGDIANEIETGRITFVSL